MVTNWFSRHLLVLWSTKGESVQVAEKKRDLYNISPHLELDTTMRDQKGAPTYKISHVHPLTLQKLISNVQICLFSLIPKETGRNQEVLSLPNTFSWYPWKQTYGRSHCPIPLKPVSASVANFENSIQRLIKYFSTDKVGYQLEPDNPTKTKCNSETWLSFIMYIPKKK